MIDITTGQLHNRYLFAIGGKGALAPLSYHYHAANADCLSTVWCWKVCVTNKHSVLSNSEDHTTFPVDHLTDTYVFLQNRVRKTFAPGSKKIMRLEDLMPGHQTVLARSRKAA